MMIESGIIESAFSPQNCISAMKLFWRTRPNANHSSFQANILPMPDHFSKNEQNSVKHCLFV